MFYQVGKDFCKYRLPPILKEVILEEIPRPEPVVEVEGAEDVVSAGVHLFEMLLNTMPGGGSLLLLIILTVVLTYCCVRGIL